jgi:hypothetical protein
MERKLASIKIIRDIQPIEQADQIELALIDGWHSVVKKGQFRVGEKVIFCEPDSILPDQPDFEFMRSKKFKIKTCKLRGVTSQGICFPMSILVADWVNWNVVDKTNLPTHINDFPEGLDVSQILNITKYEPPIPTQLRGRIRGPTNRLAVPKTDEMRVQNIPGVLERHKDAKFHVNEKIDGCVIGNTIISLPYVNMTIKELFDLQYSGKIISYDVIQNKIVMDDVIRITKTKSKKQWYLLKFENGNTIKITSEHLVYLPQENIYKPVNELLVGESVGELYG